MARKEIGSIFDRNNRNAMNENFEYLFEGSRRINELSDRADNILRDAETVNQNNIDTNKRLDRIIADSGTSSTEVIDARGNATVLRQRLDSMENQTETRASSLSSNQIDFYKLFSSKKYTETVLTKISDSELELAAQNDKEGVAYRLIKDDNDDFRKLGQGFHFLNKPKTRKIGITTHGAGWNKSFTNWYTENINDYFTFNFTGEKCIIQFYAQSMGSLWEIRVDGEVIKTVSIYAETPVYKYVEIPVDYGSHKVTCIFKGADVIEGTSNPRGAIKGAGSDGVEVIDGKERYSIKNILHNISNKEFAFSVNHNGERFWFPEHNGVGTMYDHSFVFYVDSNRVYIDSLNNGESFKGKHLSVQQRMRGYTKANGIKLADFRILHSLNLDGVLRYLGTMNPTTKFTVSAGYPLMLAVDGAVHNIAITGFGNKKISDASGDYHYFEQEKDECFNAMTTTNISGNGPYVAFAQIDKPLRTMRYGQDGKPHKNRSMFLWQRSSVPKIYFQTLSNKQFEINEVYEWGGKFGVAFVDSYASFV